MIERRGLRLNGSGYSGVHMNGYGALQLNGYGAAYGLPEDSWKRELSLPSKGSQGPIGSVLMVGGILFEVAKTYPLATVGAVGLATLVVSPKARKYAMKVLDGVWDSKGAAQMGREKYAKEMAQMERTIL